MDATTLAVIGEPTRFAIVELLRGGDAPSVSELAESLGIRQPQATKHLQVLREAGIVSAERDARRLIHRLRPEPFEELASWVSSFGSLWETRLDSLGTYLDRLDLDTTATTPDG
jgi:DNA-binding transcriptional ArsR family regulator